MGENYLDGCVIVIFFALGDTAQYPRQEVLEELL